MAATFSVWALPALMGVGLSILSGGMAARRTWLPGARALVALSAAVGWWCLLQVVILHLGTVEGKVLASKVQYLGICATPFAWYWFAQSYTGRSARVRRWSWLLLLPEVATLLLAWTNEWHGLIWERVELVAGPGYRGMWIEHGLWFRLHVYYAYALMLLATGMLAAHLAQAPHHRPQMVAAVVAPVFPWVGNLLYRSLSLPAWVIDLTPTGLAVGVTVLGWSLLRSGLLQIPAVARSRILETMGDGVVVVDREGRVVDMNRAAVRVLGVAMGEALRPPFAGAHGPGAAPTVEHAGRWYEVGASPVEGAMPGAGAVLVIRDVTDRYQMNRKLRRVGAELREANRKLERLANTDVLLGIANRRHFMERLEEETGRARRFGRPISLALLDLDHFKEINDTFGHVAGDRALELVGAAMQECTREIDVVARLGGDELALALPDTDAAGARAVVERLRARVATTSRELLGPAGLVTVSVGIAVAPAGEAGAEALLHAADVALYRAKAAGRDGIQVEEVETGGAEGIIPPSSRRRA